VIVAKTFSNRTVAVMGLARSGRSSVSSLIAGGADVVAWDDNEERRIESAAAGVKIKDLATENFKSIDALVLSPGVPHSFPKPHEAVRNAKNSGVPIIGDIEIFVNNYEKARIIGVTGTNGKSTTTALIGHILSCLGIDNDVAGNIGRPVLDLNTGAKKGFQILELSSYQLELTPSLQCEIGVLLNISPDHLDRHGGMDGYIAAKHRIIDSLQPNATAVIGVDDERSASIYEAVRQKGRVSVIPVSGNCIPPGGIGVKNNEIKSDISGKLRSIIDLTYSKTLVGSHNHQNVAAAAAVALSIGLEEDSIIPALVNFDGLPHRQELVREQHGISFINDSKATNAEAAARALASYKSIYWIAGGLSKKGGIASIVDNLENVQQAFLIGASAQEFFEILKEKIECTICRDLKHATQLATTRALQKKGESSVILLSPAAASFDQFGSYEERGDQFRTFVVNQKLGGSKKLRDTL